MALIKYIVKTSFFALLCASFFVTSLVFAESEAEFEKWAMREPKIRMPMYVDFLNKRMDEVFQKKLSESSPSDQKLLQASQKAWLAFLDADLRYERGDESVSRGSGTGNKLRERRIWQTKLRIYQLETSFLQGWSSPPYHARDLVNIVNAEQPPSMSPSPSHTPRALPCGSSCFSDSAKPTIGTSDKAGPFRYIDKEGNIYFVNRLSEVPPLYRNQIVPPTSDSRSNQH